jgi:hypothetical protein
MHLCTPCEDSSHAENFLYTQCTDKKFPLRCAVRAPTTDTQNVRQHRTTCTIDGMGSVMHMASSLRVLALQFS